MRRLQMSAIAALALVAAAGCSPAGSAPERREEPAAVAAASVVAAAGPRAAAVADQPAAKSSRVLGKKDMTLRGAPACEVAFVYAGREAENLFWEEPCAAVTAHMMTRRELAALNRWDRIDSDGQNFVEALPGGRVLYVEGSFSAAVYPVGTTGSTYEIAVAD